MSNFDKYLDRAYLKKYNIDKSDLLEFTTAINDLIDRIKNKSEKELDKIAEEFYDFLDGKLDKQFVDKIDSFLGPMRIITISEMPRVIAVLDECNRRYGTEQGVALNAGIEKIKQFTRKIK